MDPTVETAFSYVISLIILFIISIVIFLICRELVCWYWKINERLRVQKEISSKLDEIIRLLQNHHDSSQP